MGMWTTCSRPAAKGTAPSSRCNGGTWCWHLAWRVAGSQLLLWRIASARSGLLSEKIVHSKGQGVLPKASHSIRMQMSSLGSCAIVWTAIAECRWQCQYANLMSIFAAACASLGAAVVLRQSSRADVSGTVHTCTTGVFLCQHVNSPMTPIFKGGSGHVSSALC